MGWATAWSFDRLRLWLEEGIDPATSAAQSLIHAVARGVLGFIWIYQGVVPKLVFQDTGEREILRASGLVAGLESRVLTAVGLAEVAFGVLFLTLWRARSLFLVNAALLVLLVLGAAFSQPRLLVAPFNPLTLNLAMIALGFAGYLSSSHLPTSRRCRGVGPRGSRELDLSPGLGGGVRSAPSADADDGSGSTARDGVACVGRGVMDEIWHGPFYVVPFLYLGSWRRILFPDRARDVPFTIENYAYVDRFGRETVTWNRTFQLAKVRRFDATFIYSESRGGLVDYLGTHQHLAADITVTVDERGGMRLRSGATRLYEGFVAVRLPSFLTGFADVREWYDDDLQRFHIEVNVSHPRWGPLFGYTGWFVAEWPACPPGDVPASAKPVREESRE